MLNKPRWNSIKKILDEHKVSSEDMPEFAMLFIFTALVNTLDDVDFSTVLKEVREQLSTNPIEGGK